MIDKNLQEEILSGEDAQVRQMLGDLKKVEAPKDFDFRLKARIASSSAKDYEPRLFPALRIAAPLGLALIVLALFVIGGIYSVDNNSVPNIADGDIPIPNVVKDNPRDEFAAGNSQPENVGRNSNGTDEPKNPELTANLDKPKKDAPQTENNDGGSRDTAVSEANVFLPGGFGSRNSLAVKDVLEMLGIEASLSDKKWKVSSIRQNSTAERAGVKAGDTVEAINGIKLPAQTITLNGAFTGKTLTVVRGGKKIEIDLQNR